MKLFYRGEIVIATHPDDQIIDSYAYGEDVSVMTVPDDIVLERIGTLPPDPTASARGTPIIDSRPFKVPSISSIPLNKDAANAEVLSIINRFTDQFTSKYSTSEMLSWGTKDIAARAYLAGGSLSESQTLLLETEKAAGKYTSLDELCEVIIANSDKFVRISGLIAGVRVAAATDIEKAKNSGEIKTVIDGVKQTLTSALALA